MAYTKYSLTPANNTATPPDGAPEGMLPSAVNDTMRDMMAQIRDCGDGIRDGTYTMTAPKITGGTITGAAFTGNTFTSPVISGGSINNTPIGGTTANSGAFTTLSASGVATFSAGTVSAPAITTTGDTNTGIFFPAADTIAFTEGGVEAMRITAAGDVGIGGIPSFRLDVRAAQGIVSNTSTTGTNPVDYRVSNTGGNTYFGRDNSAGNAFGAGAYSTVIWSEGAYPMVLATNGSERMRIDSSGNVGIGTSSPSSYGKVAIQTSGGAVDALVLYSPSTTNGAVLRLNDNLYSAALKTIPSGGATSLGFEVSGSERMRITAGGDVVIGTTASLSSYKTTIQHTSGELLALNASSGTLTRIAFGNADASFGSTQIIANSTALALITGSAERMRITSGGRLLVGTTTENTSGGVLQVSNGITFPATQSASSDANTLDDYEEGTWTPNLLFGNASTGISYANRAGSYVKVGRVITCQGRIDLSSKGSATGTATLAGLPFTLDGGSIGAGSVGFQLSIAPSDKQVMLTLDPGSAAMVIRYASGTSTAQSTNTEFANNSTLIFSITYVTN